MVDKTKVFVSWSGSGAGGYADAIRQWLIGFDNAEPFLSREDVHAGQMGIPKIIEQLQQCRAGIIVVTRESLESQWVNFEAGYLAFAVADAERRVMPLLMDGLRKSDLTGPLELVKISV